MKKSETIFNSVRKFSVCFISAAMLSCLSAGYIAPAAAYWEYDTENPLYFENARDFVTRSSADLFNSKLGLHQRISYGINGNLAIGAEASYQIDFDGPKDGFTYSGIDLKYRTGNSGTISEFFGGVQFGGRASVPDYANTVYFVGAKIGWQWSSLVLAGTIQSSWIFHDNYGVAYVDAIPEIYLKLTPTWGLGADAMFRKATRPIYDQEWAGLKLAKRFGRTMYAGFAKYELEQEEFMFGAKLNIVF